MEPRMIYVSYDCTGHIVTQFPTSVFPWDNKVAFRRKNRCSKRSHSTMLVAALYIISILAAETSRVAHDTVPLLLLGFCIKRPLQIPS